MQTGGGLRATAGLVPLNANQLRKMVGVGNRRCGAFAPDSKILAEALSVQPHWFPIRHTSSVRLK
jgi:hypothetical protein